MSDVDRERLAELLEKARHHKMTPAEIREQHISFAYGQLMDAAPDITREDVAAVYDEMRGQAMTDTPDTPRCAECDCAEGGADCNWIVSGTEYTPDTSPEAVERFDLEQPTQHMGSAWMEPAPGYGDWVRFSDYAALSAKLQAAEAEVERLRAFVQTVADGHPKDYSDNMDRALAALQEDKG